MNENIDLTKILDGCPGGTKLYDTLYGEVSFEKIIKLEGEYIEVNYDGVSFWVTKDGKSLSRPYGECTLLPSKDQQDWSKFERFWDKPKVDKFDVNTLQPFDKVLVRDFLSDNWMADFFEKVEESNMDYYNVTCVTTHWIQCIPYNEETKHLLGKTTDCPEYYKWWEE